jgi:hypothetical protein
MQAAFTGLVGVVASGWPFWFVGLPVDLEINSGSRFGISFMLPAALIAAGLVQWAGLGIHAAWRRAWAGSPSGPPWAARLWTAAAVAILTGLAIGQSFKDANFFRQVHRSQASFFQQLAWRAPGLKPGTTILTNNYEEHLLSGDNSLTAALNWIYDPEPPYALDYMLFYIPARLVSGNLPGLEPGLPFVKNFRTTQFHGSTSETLVVYDPYPHCLRVLDPARDSEFPRPVDMVKEMKDAIRISNLEQVVAEADPPASLPESLFKYRPAENSWCYYYQKAELARQEGDWEKIVQLAKEAFREERKLDSTYELLPFIEGYIRAGKIEPAHQLTLQARRENPEGRWMTTEILCATWRRIENEAGIDATSVKEEIGCK